MGFNLSGEKIKIYKKEHDGKNGKWYSFSAGIASKNMDGEWVNGYLDVAFKKGVEIANKAVINVAKAFPTVSKYNDKTYIRWMITEFEVVDAGENTASPDDFMNIPEDVDDTLPFC